MRKQPTGEPVAGKLHTGFGGRGRRSPFPTPILQYKHDMKANPLYVRVGSFPVISVFLSCYQICLADNHRRPCHAPRMEAIKQMPREVLLEYLKLLAGYERRELERVAARNLQGGKIN